MTTDELFEQVIELAATFTGGDGEAYTVAADAFSFDANPRGDVRSIYVEAPEATVSTEYIGGMVALLAAFRIWLSRERGDDPMATARDVLADLRLLRDHVEEGLTGDVIVPSSSVSMRVGIPDDSAVVLGELNLQADHEDDT